MPYNKYMIVILDRHPIRFSLSMEMSRLTRDGTVEPVSRDQILRHARGQGNIHVPCSADHKQDWHPYPVDPYSAIDTYIHCRDPMTMVLDTLPNFQHIMYSVYSWQPPELIYIYTLSDVRIV